MRLEENTFIAPQSYGGAYLRALREAMSLCAAQPKSLVLGQAVRYPGTAMYGTLDHLPEAQRLELPVAEEMQLGMSIGLSLQGYLPISIYPRINFLLLAVNQLVNHLDKLPDYSAYRSKVIIRTAVATATPLDPGPQHLGDYSAALRMMLSNVLVVQLLSTDDILPAYQRALDRPESTILVEYASRYS